MRWTVLLAVLFVASVAAEKNTDCGDGSFCPTGTTCCPIGGGSFGCCPIPDAVCCADHLHCCPNGMTCDTTHSMCTNGYLRQPFHQKMKAERQSAEEDESREEAEERKPSNGHEQCPDHKTQCPPKTTCCADRSGHPTGCCPAEDAVCCTDGVHCCPHGSTCDLDHGTCLQDDEGDSSEFRPWFSQLAAGRTVRKVGIPFTAAVRECANGDTCAGDSTWFLPQRGRGRGHLLSVRSCHVLSGREEMLPGGFTCSQYGDECLKEENSVSISMRMTITVLAREAESQSTENQDTKCPDNSRCASGTCCPIRSSLDSEITGYQCCSLTNGVCCQNHCCPRGFVCSGDGRCERVAFSKKTSEWFN
ncbi:Granulin [Aphelenchoides fujianensis]|nr:Granulin [Aphelenchoides fujianensis]